MILKNNILYLLYLTHLLIVKNRSGMYRNNESEKRRFEKHSRIVDDIYFLDSMRQRNKSY